MKSSKYFFGLKPSETVILAIIMKYYRDVYVKRDDIIELHYMGRPDMDPTDYNLLKQFRPPTINNAFNALTKLGYLIEDEESWPRKYNLKNTPEEILEAFHEKLNDVLLVKSRGKNSASVASVKSKP